MKNYKNINKTKPTTLKKSHYHCGVTVHTNRNTQVIQITDRLQSDKFDQE